MNFQSMVILSGLVLFAGSASAQVVREELVDRMTDARTPRLVIPEARGGAMTGLIVQCNGIGIMSLPGADVDALKKITYVRRLDRAPPIDGKAFLGPKHTLTLEIAPDSQLRDWLRGGRSLALRIGQQDFEYPLAEDNAEAFALAAAVHGGNRVGARAAWGLLEDALSRAAVGSNPDVVSLLQAMKVPLKEGNRVRTPAEVLPGVARAFYNTRGKPVLDDAGRTLFGFGWSDVKPWLGNAPDYRADNGPIAAQIDWLASRCKPL